MKENRIWWRDLLTFTYVLQIIFSLQFSKCLYIKMNEINDEPVYKVNSSNEIFSLTSWRWGCKLKFAFEICPALCTSNRPFQHNSADVYTYFYTYTDLLLNAPMERVSNIKLYLEDRCNSMHFKKNMKKARFLKAETGSVNPLLREILRALRRERVFWRAGK